MQRTRRLAAIALVMATCALTPRARAQAPGAPPPESEHLVTFSVRGGAMATDDQRQVLRFDAEGASAELAGGLRPWPWLAGELSIGGVAVGGQDGVGGLLHAALAVRVMPRLDGLTPYARVAAGVGITGSLVVPVLSGVAGFWIDVAGEWSAGPELSVVHVVWEDGASRTSDAVFVSAGLAIAFRPRPSPASPPPPAERTVVRERTVLREQTVAGEPMVLERTLVVPPPPPSDPEELLRLVDRAVPATVHRSLASLVPPLLFEHDQTTLSSCGEASLYDLLRAVDDAPADTRIVVEGHADGTGDAPYNRALSERRAEAVREFLVTHGVARERITIRAAGEGVPLVEGEDERTLSLNRRVVLHLERTMSPAPLAAEPSRPAPPSEPARPEPPSGLAP